MRVATFIASLMIIFPRRVLANNFQKSRNCVIIIVRFTLYLLFRCHIGSFPPSERFVPPQYNAQACALHHYVTSALLITTLKTCQAF